ncbi:MAG: NAD-dependent epimerase/dehydratase family protein [Bacteroidetes bacterium]|nr:NAD-dependent epimerase/dehydratase family protein [Bacteroidota bacterium]MDA0874188.1 NAD-dependent epimerase/dehydratase family protein [Bacteroidota bacterium]
MTFFLTGATGFLGSWTLRHLLAQGHTVRAIRRPSSSLDLVADVADEVTWLEGDVLDPEALEAGMQGAEGVIHAAAYLGFEGKRSQDRLMEVNVGGTAMVVDAALQAGVTRMVHVSSIAALGRTEDMTHCLDESAEWRDSPMNTGYAASKYRAELEVHRGVAMGLDAVMVNPSIIMGVGRLSENTMQIADRLAQRKLPFRPKGGSSVVDVRDVATGILQAFLSGKSGQRYILAGHNLSWETILETMGDALGVVPPRKTLPRPVMMTMAGLFEFGSFISRRPAVLTRENVRLSMSVSCYDNARSRAELDMTYRPFQETAMWIAKGYRSLRQGG